MAQLACISTVCILGLSIAIPASAQLAAYYGSKTVFMASLLTFLCVSIGAGLSQSIEALIAWRCVQGPGGGWCSSTAQSTAFLHTPDAQLRQASALWDINRQLRFCLGVGLLSVLLNCLLAAQGIAALDDPVQHLRAVQVFHWCFALATSACVLLLALCARIDNRAVLDLLQHHRASKNASREPLF